MNKLELKKQSTMLLFTSILLVFCSLLSCTTSLKPSRLNITGGTEVTDRTKFGYQALIIFEESPTCGGTIIDEQHVLTAAHCFISQKNDLVNPTDMYVVDGNLNVMDRSSVRFVTDIFVHENYDSVQMINDIAVLRIAGAFPNTEQIHAINLTTDHVTNGTCVVSGWGAYVGRENLLVSTLMSAEVPIFDLTTCKEMYEINDEAKIICAGKIGREFCEPDSGGPLVCSGLLTGVVSHGDGCNWRNYPWVYTEVAKYIEWIETQKQRVTSRAATLTSLLFLTLFVTIMSISWL